MLSRRTLAVLLFAQFFAAVAMGQEFARASAGQIEVLTKAARSRSGSLALRTGDMNGFDATLGGSLLADRLWFFGTATFAEGSVSRLVPAAAGSVEGIDAKFNAQLGAHQTLAASYGNSVTTISPGELSMSLPSSFLSLRYDAILSPKATFSGRFSRSTTSASPIN